MEIYREGNELVLRVSLTQPSYDALGDHSHDTANLIGVIAGNDCSISYLSDLGYKGTQQEGAPLICFWGDPEQLRKVCKDLDIDVWEYSLCAGCKEPLRDVIHGSLEITKRYGGDVCSTCAWKLENEQKSNERIVTNP